MSAADTRRRHYHHPGFSLLELLAVLAIISITLLAAAPSFRRYLQTQQVNSSAAQFLFALNLARSEAMQRGQRVDVAARDGKRWENGWIVFVHEAGQALPPSSSAALLYSHTPHIPALRVLSRLSDSTTANIAYNGYGRPRTNTSALTRQMGTLQFSVQDQVRLIRIELGGRARLCNPANDRSCEPIRQPGTESRAPQENMP